MASGVTVSLDVEGLARMREILDRLPKEVAGPITKDALTAAAETIKVAAAANIRRGSDLKPHKHTADDLRVVVQVDEEKAEGAAGIGARERNFVVRFLEFGAVGKKSGGRGWTIKGGASDARLVRKASRALRRTGNRAGAAAFKLGVASGDIKVRHALKLPGGIFRASAHHPGFAPQAPLTRALASEAQNAVDKFGTVLEQGISAAVKRYPIQSP